MQPSRPRQFARSALAVVLLAALPGCAPKLIGDYDDAFDQGVTAVEQKTELYLAKLKSNPGTAFDQSFYDETAASLAVLKTRAAALPKYEILRQEVANLQSELDDFQKLDKASARPIPAAVVAAGQTPIEVSFESILKLEVALKRTGTTPSAAMAPAKK